MQGEAFGCPYKTASPQELTEQLRAMRLPPRVVEEAVSKARGHHYQLACTVVFQGQHNCICESGISHPNQVCCLELVICRGACECSHSQYCRLATLEICSPLAHMPDLGAAACHRTYWI